MWSFIEGVGSILDITGQASRSQWRRSPVGDSPSHEEITAALTDGPLAEELVRRAQAPSKVHTSEEVAARIRERHEGSR